MNDDAELLRRYAVEHAEDAFAELVRRHVDLVYSAALRLMNRDVHRAQDVAQQAFTEFARQAKRLASHPNPVGWLYTTTRLCALRAIRTEQRRHARDQEASIMNELLRRPEPEWEQLQPVLEDAMHELGDTDRNALLLRFFQNRSHKDVGLALDLNENAARMRVDRALEKLRVALLRRGISTSAALASVISANSVQAAPAGLAMSLASTAVANSAAGTFTLLKIMTATQIKIGASLVVAAAMTAALVVEYQARDKLRGENIELAQQLAQARADDALLSNRLAAANAPNTLTDQERVELLKLRGETARLKNQLAVVEKPRNPMAGVKLPDNAQDAATQQRQVAMRRLRNAKNLASALMSGWDRHRDQFPTNWDQVAPYFDRSERDGLNPGDVLPDTAADFSEMTNLFEFTYQGAYSNLYDATNFHDIIVVRERQAWQSSEGTYLKTYGFADGHSQIQAQPPEGFQVYEQHHMTPIPGQ